MDGFLTWAGENSLWILLGIGAALTAIWLSLLRKRLNMAWYAAVLLAVLHTAVGVLTVKVFAFLETGFAPDSLGNMSLFGGVFFMPLAYWIGAKLSKRPAREVFDIFTPCMIFTVMCARVNCLVSGCCFGLPIPGMNGIRFPTREAEILFYLLILAVLCPRVFRGRTRGQVYPLYMIGYGAFRFATEFFRDAGTASAFHLAHLWAMITLLLGISIYAEIYHRKFYTKRRR